MRGESILLIDKSLLVLFIEPAHRWFTHSMQILLYRIFQVVGAPTKLICVNARPANKALILRTVTPGLLLLETLLFSLVYVA